MLSKPSKKPFEKTDAKKTLCVFFFVLKKCNAVQIVVKYVWGRNFVSGVIHPYSWLRSGNNNNANNAYNLNPSGSDNNNNNVNNSNAVRPSLHQCMGLSQIIPVCRIRLFYTDKICGGGISILS